MPATAPSVVVFPAPLRPTMVTTRPEAIRNDTSHTAVTDP